MEKYCKKCGRVFDELNYKLCPFCGGELATRYGRQPIPRQLRHKVFKRDSYRCRECGASKDETSLEIDHIIPVARGGTNDIDNLQTLCRECNRMKHIDEWVGGETDFEVVKKELNSLRNQIIETKQRLKMATTEDEKIEYEYQIMILEERLPKVEKKYNNLYEINNEIEAKRKKEEKSKKLYKKLYVKLDDEAFLKWAEDNSVSHRNKKMFIESICNSSEQKVNDYIYTVQLYRELLDNPEKLNKYDKLFTELDDESLEILRELSSWNFRKGLLILECMNKYGDDNIKNIINERKEEIKEKIEKNKKIEERKKIVQNKIKIFKIKQNAILKIYNKHISLSKAAEITGYNAKDACIWYYRGKCGHPVYEEFYNEINKIREPWSSEDMKYIPNEIKWYCDECGRLNSSRYCPYCKKNSPINPRVNKINKKKNKTPNKSNQKNYNKCRSCGKFILKTLTKCPYCGSTNIKKR